MLIRSLDEIISRSQNPFFKLTHWQSTNTLDYVSWEIVQHTMGSNSDAADRKNLQDLIDPRSGYVFQCYANQNILGEFGVLQMPNSIVVRGWLNTYGISSANFDDFTAHMQKTYGIPTT